MSCQKEIPWEIPGPTADMSLVQVYVHFIIRENDGGAVWKPVRCLDQQTANIIRRTAPTLHEDPSMETVWANRLTGQYFTLRNPPTEIEVHSDGL